MGEPKKRTISYHRAEYLVAQKTSINLGMCIKAATEKLTTVEARTISRDGGQVIKLAAYKVDEDKGHFLHLTADTPDGHMSIVPKVDVADKEVSVSTVAPPKGAEYMDGDAFLYVRANDICICMTDLHIGAIRQFLYGLFEKAKLRSDAALFEFMNAPDTVKLAKIQANGVEAIELNASLFDATLMYAKRTKEVVGVLDNVARHFKALFGADPDVREKDALKIAVVLSADRRNKGISIGQKRLDELAVRLVGDEEDHDGFVIQLKGGDSIRPGEIFLRERVEIEGKGKSVVRDEAWDKLFAYYQSLSTSGALVQ